MMKILFLFFFALLLENPVANAQACGGGVYVFTFYSVNGTHSDDIRYDFYEVDTDSLKARLTQPDQPGTIKLDYFGQHFTINSIDGIVINAHKSGKVRKNQLNKMSGSVHNGRLQVVTRELFSVPHLLRVTTGGKELYYIGNFFGGCYGSLNILLN
ncbi:MAG TPA: hypothetical protein VL092_05470 [Chitinophagaceae bacterium]|nr:hypothetical protein [Chitinophagaceae bacterium]